MSTRTAIAVPTLSAIHEACARGAYEAVLAFEERDGQYPNPLDRRHYEDLTVSEKMVVRKKVAVIIATDGKTIQKQANQALFVSVVLAIYSAHILEGKEDA